MMTEESGPARAAQPLCARYRQNTPHLSSAPVGSRHPAGKVAAICGSLAVCRKLSGRAPRCTDGTPLLALRFPHQPAQSCPTECRPRRDPALESTQGGIASGWPKQDWAMRSAIHKGMSRASWAARGQGRHRKTDKIVRGQSMQHPAVTGAVAPQASVSRGTKLPRFIPAWRVSSGVLN